MAYDLRSCGLVREDSRERGRKSCEGCREWTTTGKARMASSETGVARSYLDYGERTSMCARLLASISFNVRFRFLFVSLERIYYCEYLK